jgi:hypothetical protein
MILVFFSGFFSTGARTWVFAPNLTVFSPKENKLRKGTFRLLIALAAVLAFAGTAFGAGQVTLKTTVPNIPKSVSFQAGTVTMEMDHLTEMREGDIIQFTTSNGTTISKEINFYLRLTDGAAGFNPGQSTTLPISTSDTANEINITEQNPGNNPAGGVDYGFLVRGRAGDQRINLTFGRRDIATGEFVAVTNPLDQAGGPNPNFVGSFFTFDANAAGGGNISTDRLVIRLFDEKDSTEGVALQDPFGDGDGFFFKDDLATPGVDYLLTGEETTRRGSAAENQNNEFIWSDNTLCIDTLTQDFQAEFVEVTPDSRPTDWDGTVTRNALSFSGDFRIAKILAEQELDFATPKGATTGNILDAAVGQTAVTCRNFDFETGSGFCAGSHSGNKLIVESLNAPFIEGAEFVLTLDVLVNGQAGDRGVYFSSAGGVQVQGYETLADAASGTSQESLPGNYFLANGSAAVPFAGNQCTVPNNNRAVQFVSQLSRMSLNENAPFNDRFLEIDLPGLTYDNSLIEDGDVVSVRVSLSQEPCGFAFQGSLTVGTFGCGDAPTATNALLFPFFTSADSAAYDAAFVVTNLGNAAGDVTLYWYEADGDAFEATVPTPVEPHSIWNSGVVRTLPERLAWTQIAGSGTPGDAPTYMVACTQFPSDGFGFIFNGPEGNSMGYIPRTTATTSGYNLPNVCD